MQACPISMYETNLMGKTGSNRGVHRWFEIEAINDRVFEELESLMTYKSKYR